MRTPNADPRLRLARDAAAAFESQCADREGRQREVDEQRETEPVRVDTER